ncbi:MAG: hypothetical protein KDA61_02915, partial [Planctomycetales bacterium]|nr:hypothetical protein [Planctomycetales bacterium]
MSTVAAHPTYPDRVAILNRMRMRVILVGATLSAFSLVVLAAAGYYAVMEIVNAIHAAQNKAPNAAV